MEQYVKPALSIVNCDLEGAILSASGDNPYWKGSWGEPEAKEGCDNAYWCDK